MKTELGIMESLDSFVEALAADSPAALAVWTLAKTLLPFAFMGDILIYSALAMWATPTRREIRKFEKRLAQTPPAPILPDPISPDRFMPPPPDSESQKFASSGVQ